MMADGNSKYGDEGNTTSVSFFSSLIAHNICKKLFPFADQYGFETKSPSKLPPRANHYRQVCAYSHQDITQKNEKLSSNSIAVKNSRKHHEEHGYGHVFTDPPQSQSKIQVVKNIDISHKLAELFKIFSCIDQNFVNEVLDRHPNQLNAYDVILSVVTSGLNQIDFTANFEDRSQWPDLVQLAVQASENGDSCSSSLSSAWEVLSEASDLSDFSLIENEQKMEKTRGGSIDSTYEVVDEETYTDRSSTAESFSGTDVGFCGGGNPSPHSAEVIDHVPTSTSPFSYLEAAKKGAMVGASKQHKFHRFRTSGLAFTKLKSKKKRGGALVSRILPRVDPFLRQKIIGAFDPKLQSHDGVRFTDGGTTLQQPSSLCRRCGLLHCGGTVCCPFLDWEAEEIQAVLDEEELGIDCCSYEIGLSAPAKGRRKFYTTREKVHKAEMLFRRKGIRRRKYL